MTELTDELTTMTTKRSGRNIDAASLDLEAIKARSEAATEGPWDAPRAGLPAHRIWAAGIERMMGRGHGKATERTHDDRAHE